MKKNLLVSLALSIVMAFCVGLFSACFDDEDDDDDLIISIPSVESTLYKESDSTIYLDGEQTIVLCFTEALETAQTTFKSTAAASDITLSGVLTGKTVKSVTYHADDETKLTVVLEGKVTADKSHAQEEGTITVLKNAVSTNKDYSCKVTVDFNPCMTCKTVVAERGNYRSYFYLPYGSFIAENANTDNIIITNLTEGATLEVEINDAGGLKVTVRGFTPTEGNQYPVANIGANVTTFDKALTVNIGEKCSIELL